MNWYNKSWNDVVTELKSDVDEGLDITQVEEINKENGGNIIKIPKSNSFFNILLKQIFEPWSIIMLLSLSIYLYFNKWIEIFLFIIMFFISIGILSIIKYREENELLELKKLEAFKCKVIRDGKEEIVLSEELVNGDIVILNKNEIVPADIRIIEAYSLKVKEGAITGEGDLVEKYSTMIEEREIPLSEMRNILFKSSVIIDGYVKGIVISTGIHTKISEIISASFKAQDNKASFINTLKKIVNQFVLYILYINFMFLLIRTLFLKKSITNSLVLFANTNFAGIPISLIFIFIIIISFAQEHFNKGNINLKDISVIEKLSMTNLILKEKVGSFSEEYVNVEKVYTNNTLIHHKDIDNYYDKDESHMIKRLLHIGILCNDTKFIDDNYVNEKMDLSEIELVRFSLQFGIKKYILEDKYKRLYKIPYDKERRMMTTINYIDGNYRAHVKGSVNSILSTCTHILKNGIEREVTDEEIRNIKNMHRLMSTQGLAVTAFAYRNFNYEPSLKENIESNLVFVGIIGFLNPPKENIEEVLREFNLLNIRPILITEENKLTAEAFGKKIGIINNIKKSLTGAELDNITLEELKRILSKINVFSRIGVKHKLKIAEHFKENNLIFMEGSKVSDLPYLMLTNVSYSYGKSNILKNICDMSGEKISLETLLNTIKSCRKMINKINSAIEYMFTIYTCNVLSIILLDLLNYSIGINLIDIFWTSFLTISIGGLCIFLDFLNEEDIYYGNLLDKNILKDNKVNFFVRGIFINALLGGIIYILLRQDFQYMMLAVNLVNNIIFAVYSLKFFKFNPFKNSICRNIFILNLILQMLYIGIKYYHNLITMVSS
ncbi:cation-transporting P-type ATPase [Clostridium sp. HMP27]|uniref:P-type ATPase n=1 Tax=Clostridium sp. HMP27 TaxID=1487921 RepID=UPI00068FB2B6|nr:cation-transporting P-type ATPase [Clostridium sp. HMP27]